MSAESVPSISVSPYSCLGCREAKRKCDRIHPECTLCAQKNIPCAYPHRRKRRELRQPPEASSPAISGNVASPESSLATKPAPLLSAEATTLLAERFMDPEVFSFAQLEVPTVNLEGFITEEIAALVGDVQDIQTMAQFYFDTVHSWMPIVSKIGFSQCLVKRMTHQRAEFFLLVLSMKLCDSRVTEARTRFYRVVRQLYADIERSGAMSLLVLQASVLIALYEMGHGLYPDAFLSVAQCARYGTALGVDKTIVSRGRATTQWPDLEESRRVWWSILVLDRFMNLCDPKRHLVTPDPDSTSYLPIDDEEWDAGTSTAENAFMLGSAISLRLGRFARFAQAAHLLSQVLHQVGDQTSDTAQLRRTIFSLVNVSRIEADMRQLEFCTQMAVCYSGIILLDHPTSLPSRPHPSPSDLSTETSSILQSALKMSLYFSDAFVAKVCDLISPFLLYLMYKVTAVCMRRSFGQPAESVDVKNTEAMKMALRYLSRRWLGADVYLSLLGRLEVLLMTQRYGMLQFRPSGV